MRSAILIILFATLFAQATHAQSTLLIKKRGKIIATFREGDHLKFKLKGEDFYYNQLILGFSGEHIHFKYYDLHISEIGTINAHNKIKSFPAVISGLSSRAAIIFFAADMFNQGIVKRDGFEPSEPTLIITGGLAATSLLTKLLAGNKVKIDGRKFTIEML